MSKNKNKINALVLSVIIAVLSVLGIQTDVYAANNVTGPKYDYNERKWVYSYVYYGMYPQSEVVYKGNSAQISALASRNVQSYIKVRCIRYQARCLSKMTRTADAEEATRCWPTCRISDSSPIVMVLTMRWRYFRAASFQEKQCATSNYM